MITQVTSSDAKQFVHKQAPENLNIRRTEEKIINLQNQRVRPGTPTCVNIKSQGINCYELVKVRQQLGVLCVQCNISGGIEQFPISFENTSLLYELCRRSKS